MTYAQMLRDPRWQKKRLQILERDGWACASCEDATKTLEVHHKRYLKNKKPWEYDDRYLQTLCTNCHKDETRATEALREVVAQMWFSRTSFLAGVAAGLIIVSDWFETDGGMAVAPWAPDAIEIMDHEMARGMGVVLGCEAEQILDVLDGCTLKPGALAKFKLAPPDWTR